MDALGRGRNAMAIWQDLIDDHGFTARYASVRRFVVALRGSRPTEARVVITTAPGEEGQVDYGEGPMVRWTATAKYRRTRLFVFTLAHSRKAVRLLTWRSSAQIWCELHERAFRRLGGTVKVVVLDNLKEGVLTPDIYGRRYLERRLPAPLTLRQVDPLIRQLTLYRDLIDRKTGDPL